MIDFRELLQSIRTGTLSDEETQQLRDALKIREQIKGLVNFSSLKAGDRVRFVERIRPTYLAGVEATVKDKKTKKIVVDLDSPIGRFSKAITVPVELLEKV